MVVRKPDRLQPGMTIGVVAVSSGVRDKRLEPGIGAIEARGYRVVRGEHMYDQYGYLAGLDYLRAADLNAMLARDDVDAVFCARGGYGACRVLDHVDWEAAAARRKLLAGYSDVTTLHLAFERRFGMPTIHGPMVATLGGRLSVTARDSFWRAVECAEPLGRYETGDRQPRTLVGGRATGRLAGGCLSLLGAAVGTWYAPDFDGRIVLIEDVNEKPYRIDRLLMQLRHAGLLERAAGFVIGRVTPGPGDEPAEPLPITYNDVWRDLIAALGKPAIAGFPFGHVPSPLTLPLGCQAELDADAGSLTVLEAAVT